MSGPSTRFALSSDDCELLCALERGGRVEAVAKELGKHASVVSRQLTSIAARAPVAEKAEGKWRLTPTGLEVVRWAREQAAVQERLLRAPTTVTLATTRDFGAIVVAPALAELRAVLAVSCVRVTTVASGVERRVLSGEADAGITCGRASDPAVSFRSLAPERYAVVAPASWRRTPARELLGKPHLLFARAPTARLLGLSRELEDVVGIFDDMSAVRHACVAGHGWCVLPRYVVARELDAGTLVTVDGFDLPQECFGVFWLRSRTNAHPWLEALCGWLRERSL